MDFSQFEYNENAFTFSNLLNSSTVLYQLISPSDLHLQKRITTHPNAIVASPKRPKSGNAQRRRGRPRKIPAKCNGDDKPPDENGDAPNRIQTTETTPLSRTRYGRVTRPPKHMSKFIDIDEPVADHLATEQFPAINEPENTFQLEHTDGMTDSAPEPKKIRRNLERFTCDVCKKVRVAHPSSIWRSNSVPLHLQQIYLSKKKMLSHLKAFPDHKMPFDHRTPATNGLKNGTTTPTPSSPTNSILFNELIRNLSTATQNERCKFLLDELSNFITHLNVLKDSLLPSCNTDCVHNQSHYIDKNVGQLFSIQAGTYDLNADLLQHYQHQMIEQKNAEIFESTLPSVVSIQPSQYDLVPINEVNYDQITDNAMEAVSLDKILSKDNDVVVPSPILDISLDMFQFNGTWTGPAHPMWDLRLLSCAIKMHDFSITNVFFRIYYSNCDL